MPSNVTTQAALVAARSAFRAAALTFATSTVPPLAVTLETSVLALSGGPGENIHPHFADPADADYYRHTKIYVDRLIASGAYAGPALPFR